MQSLEKPQIFYSHFKRELSQELKTPAIHLSQRTGFLLKAVWPDKITYGEASPLLHYSEDTIESVQEYFSNTSTDQLLSDWLLKKDIPASIRMAIDTIFSSIESSSNTENKKITSNAMISLSSPQEINLEQIKKKWQEGYRVFKFKVDPSTVDSFCECAEVLSTISQNNNSERYKIRLDSNHGFSPGNIIEFAYSIRKLPIEYWEDPLPITDLYSWLYFKKECTIPIAIDQPIKNLTTLTTCLENKAADVFILKPTCLGGFNNTISAMNLIKKVEKSAVITTAIETEIARRAIQNFSLQYYPWSKALGLSTGGLYKINFLKDEALITSESALKSNPLHEEEVKYLNSLEWKSLS